MAQGLRPVIQVGLEVLLRHPVPRHRLQPQHVLAHQPQELTGAAEMVALGGHNLDGVPRVRRIDHVRIQCPRDQTGWAFWTDCRGSPLPRKPTTGRAKRQKKRSSHGLKRPVGPP